MQQIWSKNKVYIIQYNSAEMCLYATLKKLFGTKKHYMTKISIYYEIQFRKKMSLSIYCKGLMYVKLSTIKCLHSELDLRT